MWTNTVRPMRWSTKCEEIMSDVIIIHTHTSIEVGVCLSALSSYTHTSIDVGVCLSALSAYTHTSIEVVVCLSALSSTYNAVSAN